MDKPQAKPIVEALIFAADEPLHKDRIFETLELPNDFDLGGVIEELNQDYQNSGRSFTIRQVAGGYQIATQAEFSSWIRKLYSGRQKTRLSQAALETLALIAFKQPISRVDIGQIRGVNSDGVIGNLLEKKLITISGRSEAVGRPLLYSTTPEFLKYFGINDITDLPKPREIEELFSKEGMPEELLQALSQTDAQLSLPINGETEAPAEEERSQPPTIKKSAIVEVAPSPATEVPAAETLSIESEESAPTATILPDEATVVSEVPETTTAASGTENAAIDINEDAVSRIDDSNTTTSSSDEPVAAISASSTQNEIAWISLHATEDEVKSAAIDEITETISTDVAQTDEVVDPRGDLAAETLVAGVEEIIETRTTSETAEARVVEMADIFINEPAAIRPLTNAGESDAVIVAEQLATPAEVIHADQASWQEPTVVRAPSIFDETSGFQLAKVHEFDPEDVLQKLESPPEFKDNPDVEIDGWVAEEISDDEIVEPDFLKKTEDFFLEEVPASTSEANGAEVKVIEDLPVAPTILADDLTVIQVDETTIVELDGEEKAPEENSNVWASSEASPSNSSFSVEPAITIKNDAEPVTHMNAAAEANASRETLRDRVVGWFKRTFNKLISWVGGGSEADI